MKRAASRPIKTGLAVAVLVPSTFLVARGFGEWARASADFMPHGYCYLWNPEIVWLHVISDALITLSYYAIPIILIYFIRKNRDLPFNRIFWMFGGFILACGTTHLMEIWNVWHGSYMLAGVIKAATAAISVSTAAMLIPLVPEVVSLPGRMHLQDENRKLEREIADRKRFDAPIEAPLRRRATAGFIAAVLLTLFIGFSTWRGARRAEQDEYWVSHTHEVMETIQRTSRHAIETVTAARAFALSGEESLLANYQKTRASVSDDQNALRHLTADNLSQQRRLDVLAIEMNTALEFAAKIIAERQRTRLYPGGADAVESERLLDVVRATTHDMYAEESRLLIQRNQRAQGGQRLTKVIAVAGAFLGVGLWELARLAVNRQIDISERARAQLGTLNAELEKRVQQRTAALEAEIVERKRAGEALKKSLATSEDVLKELADQKFALDQHAIVATTDVQGTITYVNDKFCAISKYSREELLGQNHRILNSRHHPKAFFQQMYHSIANGQVWRDEICNRAKDGSTYWVDTTVVPFLGSNGKPRQYVAIRADITERKRAEEALRESLATREAALKELATQKFALDQHAIVATTDVQGTITYANDKFCAISKYSREELLGQNHRILNSGHHSKEFFRQMYHTIANGYVWRNEICNRAKDGSIYWVDTTIVPLSGEDGKPHQYIAIRADITERKRAEAALQEQAQVLDLAQVMVRDLKGRIVLWSKGTEKLYGYSQEEAIGRVSHELLQTQFSKPLPELEAEVTLTGVWEGELVHRKKNGTHVVVASMWVLHRDAAGNPLRILESNTDITERQRAEERLARQSEELLGSQQDLEGQKRMLQSVLDSMTEGLVAADAQGRFLLWNPAARKIVGMGAANVPPKDWSNHYGVFMEDTITPFPEERNPLVRSIRGESSTAVMFVRNPEIEEGAWIEISANPLRDGDGKVCGGVTAFRDITQRRLDEQKIRKLNDELEERVVQRTQQLEIANKELEAFTYSVSHDLRAPLRHIAGFSKMLMEDFGPGLAPEAQRYLQRIEDGVHRMGLLVDELLNLARVGRHSLNLQVTRLNLLIEEVVSMLQPEANGRIVTWKIADLPSAECDPILVKQVFQNLLANALKFTRTRERAVIEISHHQHNGEMVIAVRDNGVGFSMKYKDKLFGTFQRLHRAEEFEGTGIGLATVQRIVHKHGGRAWAEAELDHGATFFFTLGTAKPRELKATELANQIAAAGA